MKHGLVLSRQNSLLADQNERCKSVVAFPMSPDVKSDWSRAVSMTPSVATAAVATQLKAFLAQVSRVPFGRV